MKFRLLFVISQLFKGGAETSLVSMLKKLDKNTYDVDVVIFDHPLNTTLLSLIPEIPEWVTTFVQNTRWEKIPYRIRTSLISPYSKKLLDFIMSRQYDLAISFGEWFSPDLVMKYANAGRKAIWLHSDIAQSLLVNPKELFRYDSCTDFYICVSKQFQAHMLERFPFLENKSRVIHNCSDSEMILKLAQEIPPESFRIDENTPCILSVGNLRPEKNYLRTIEAATILKRENIPFRWYCVGAFSHETTVTNIKKAIAQNGLEDCFILLGSLPNPYSLMSRASVLVLSSDHESWSMVIGEAKILGLPVVTTRTDGAIEQLQDGENALFCDFSGPSLAAQLKRLLGTPELLERLRLAIKNSCVQFSPDEEIRQLLSVPQMRETDLLLVMDDANYQGGAHTAVRYLLQELDKKGYRTEVFSGISPTIETRNRFSPIPITSLDIQKITAWESIPFLECLFSREFSWRDKFCKFKRAVEKRLHLHRDMWKKDTSLLLKKFFSGYRRICVMSEGSIFRKEVALSTCPYKFQMIHTNYGEWCRFSEYTRNLTAFDAQLYAKMKGVLLISRKSRDSFLEIFPKFRTKCFAVQNIIRMPVRTGKRPIPSSPLHLLTIARLEEEKDIPRMLSLAQRLKTAGVSFDWTLLGTSSRLEYYREQTRKLQIDDVFFLKGQVDSVGEYLKDADLFLLLSHYEGLPNTIYEALISGVPVLATAVGGIPEQIEDGVTGFLVPDEENAIFDKIMDLCAHPEKITSVAENLTDYQYDNEKVLMDYVRIFQL